jgi:hypothetical protein
MKSRITIPRSSSAAYSCSQFFFGDGEIFVRFTLHGKQDSSEIILILLDDDLLPKLKDNLCTWNFYLMNYIIQNFATYLKQKKHMRKLDIEGIITY